jgi:hypothetical protein
MGVDHRHPLGQWHAPSSGDRTRTSQLEPGGDRLDAGADTLAEIGDLRLRSSRGHRQADDGHKCAGDGQAHGRRHQ